MGLGRGPSNDHRIQNPEFRLEKYSLLVQDPTDDNFRQRETVRQSSLQGLLFKPGHQEPILVTRAPPGKRTDGSDKSNTAQDHQDQAGQCEGRLARRTAPRPLGIQDNS